MISIKELDTRSPKELSKKETIEETEKLADKIGDLQHILYAQKKYSLLVVLQGMDAAGKDGTTSDVFKCCTPGAIHVISYKKPSEEEFAHDFLWRIHQNTPAKGYIHVFNRSHYEDILIQKVHGWIDDEKRNKRMQAINTFEELLQFDNNTLVLKFFLNISEERQKEKLMERVQDPKKQWKHSDGDWEERKHWSAYMEAYEYVLQNSTIPWTIVPADHSWYRNYVVAKRVFEALNSLDLELPGLDSSRFV
jgi:PPK2 family polyphosphate:nucleotide phosphotransferase